MQNKVRGVLKVMFMDSWTCLKFLKIFHPSTKSLISSSFLNKGESSTSNWNDLSSPEDVAYDATDQTHTAQS